MEEIEIGRILHFKYMTVRLSIFENAAKPICSEVLMQNWFSAI